MKLPKLNNANMSVLTSPNDYVQILNLKAPITTAADDKFCDIFPNFRNK